MEEENIHQIALSILPGLGPIKAKSLISAVGSLEGIFKEKESHLAHIKGIPRKVLRDSRRKQALLRAEKELKFIRANNIRLHYFKDSDYPNLLRQCCDCPIALFTLGNVHFNSSSLSVVGTRRATDYGKKITKKLVQDLSPYSAQVVSGLAHGIDKIAHESAVHHQLSTIGVLGHGLDTLYPAANRSLAKQMLEKGGLVTEYISGVVGDPKNFPRRNRIIAGLSEATVVIESGKSGGSLITANLANSYDREVFAFPGHIDSESSKGCHDLIRHSKAHLITSVPEMVALLGWEKTKDVAKNVVIFDDLNETEEEVVQLFKKRRILDMEALVAALKMTTTDMTVHLFNLEMKNIIKAIQGRRYCLS